MTDLEALAREMSEKLFTNGAGEKAGTLVLTSGCGENLGGWCKIAVVEQILTALQKAAEPPDGWKLVPKEPTEEMGKASGIKSTCCCGRRITVFGVNSYPAMLAAAPKPDEVG